MYYWIIDYRTDHQNRLHPVVIKGRAFTTEVRAQEYIDSAGGLSPRAEIFELDTTDQSKATEMLKAKLIQKYQDLDRGMERAVHNVQQESGSY